jgi:hypothetical protein
MLTQSRSARVFPAGSWTRQVALTKRLPTMSGPIVKPGRKLLTFEPKTRTSIPSPLQVVRLDREFDDPFPKDVHDLDMVAIVLTYHDTFWMKANRRKMNAAVFKALRHGGSYVVIDHSAVAGHGAKDVESLHRVDEALVRKEILAAGFKAAGQSEFLRNPADQRDWTVFDKARRGTTDRFAIKFVKP